MLRNGQWSEARSLLTTPRCSLHKMPHSHPASPNAVQAKKENYIVFIKIQLNVQESYPIRRQGVRTEIPSSGALILDASKISAANAAESHVAKFF
ncbi:hypothetical protein V5799_010006 [Amblyomma americanum]|uniref:Uncharacterized protein n=1 Tax=Amblyomma americanum TaxID=6943 RepID=A0AAQ4F8U1_AMBAM